MKVALSLLQEEVEQSIVKHRFNPAGSLNLESLNCDDKADLKATCKLYIYPNIEFEHLDRIQVERPRVIIAESDVLKVVNKVRKGFAPWVLVERKPQDGDVVTILVTQDVPGSTGKRWIN